MAQSANMTGITRTRYLGTISSSILVLSNLQSNMVNDLDNVFFNTDEFAEYSSIQYTHSKSGITETYKAIYDDPTQDIKAGSNTEIIALKPQIQMPLPYMKEEPNINDVLVVRGIRYSIDSYESDGVGVITIYLIRENKRFKT